MSDGKSERGLDEDQHHDSGSDDAPESDSAQDRYQGVPPFTVARLERELLTDALLRWGVVAVVGVAFGIIVWLGAGATMAAVAALGLVVAAWLLLNLTSARVSRELPQLAGMIEAEPMMAEDQLARHLRARPLLAWVRLMLYHRLAGLRHRQQRFEESLAICAALLPRRLGPAREARGHLLLMLVEAALERRDLVSAYHGLAELYHTRLSLVEALQRFALQARYEVACGYHQRALERAAQKVQLAELMPANQCGAVHAVLATAATHAQHGELARWFWQRAELLCTPEQLDELKTGGFGVGIVESMRPHEAA